MKTNKVLTFENADYFTEINDYEKQFSTLSEAYKEGFKLEEIIAVYSNILISDSHGVNIPKIFASNFEAEFWNIDVNDSDHACLLLGPEGNNEWYWEAWNNICSSAFHVNANGLKFTLHQDGDLFAKCFLDHEGKNV